MVRLTTIIMAACGVASLSACATPPEGRDEAGIICDLSSSHACFSIFPDAEVLAKPGPDFMTFNVSVAGEPAFFVYEGFAPGGYDRAAMERLEIGESIEQTGDCTVPNARLIKVNDTPSLSYYLDVRMSCT